MHYYNRNMFLESWQTTNYIHLSQPSCKRHKNYCAFNFHCSKIAHYFVVIVAFEIHLKSTYITNTKLQTCQGSCGETKLEYLNERVHVLALRKVSVTVHVSSHQMFTEKKTFCIVLYDY